MSCGSGGGAAAAAPGSPARLSESGRAQHCPRVPMGGVERARGKPLGQGERKDGCTTPAPAKSATRAPQRCGGRNVPEKNQIRLRVRLRTAGRGGARAEKCAPAAEGQRGPASGLQARRAAPRQGRTPLQTRPCPPWRAAYGAQGGGRACCHAAALIERQRPEPRNSESMKLMMKLHSIDRSTAAHHTSRSGVHYIHFHPARHDQLEPTAIIYGPKLPILIHRHRRFVPHDRSNARDGSGFIVASSIVDRLRAFQAPSLLPQDAPRLEQR